MPIDPVIALLEEIRLGEEELRRQSAQNAPSFKPEQEERTLTVLRQVLSLYDALYIMVPTSAVGAGALLSLACRWLPSSYLRYEQHLARIAERLQAGRRLPDDLIWLRALAQTLETDPAKDRNMRLRAVLKAALQGASRPVLIFRNAFCDPQVPTPDLEELSRGRHFWPAPFNQPSPF